MGELTIRELTVEFDSGGYVVRPLDHFSFEADDGELVAVVGPSGCGKTTMLSCLAGLLTPTSGSIRFRDIEVTTLAKDALSQYRRSTVGVVFQAFNLIPSLTARGNVMAPLRLSGVPRQPAMARADELLAQVGLTDRAGNRPGRMSGGQQQRVAIARALVHQPPLILADEPTAHLDHIQVEGVLRLLRQLAEPGRLVLVVTHDDRITHIADRVIEMVPKFATSDRPPEEVVLQQGQLLFRQGDRGDLVYVVEQGEIEIHLERSDGTEERLNVVGPGGYFGELGPALNLPRSASARALTPSRLTGYPIRAFRRRFPATSAPRHVLHDQEATPEATEGGPSLEPETTEGPAGPVGPAPVRAETAPTSDEARAAAEAPSPVTASTATDPAPGPGNATRNGFDTQIDRIQRVAKKLIAMSKKRP